MTQTYEQTVGSTPIDVIDSTLGAAETSTPLEFIDEYATHNALRTSLDKIQLEVGLNNAPTLDTEILKQEIIEQSRDLAAQILPQDICEELQIAAKIPDNTSLHHPPSTDELVLLGAAWDVTNDDVTLEALKHAVNETEEPDAPLVEKAIDVATEPGTSTSFVMAFNNILEEKMKAEANTPAELDTLIDNYSAAQATTYIDVSPHSITKEELVARRNNVSFDELNERLVTPVAMPFVSLEKDGAEVTIPTIVFRSSSSFREERIRRFTDNAIEAAS